MDTDFLFFLIFLFGSIVILVAIIVLVLKAARKLGKKEISLSRHHKNPVLSPSTHAGWEGVGTFNPAAVMDDAGRVHIVYRAVGTDGLSSFGYAVSEDGSNFSDKSPYPIFAMYNPGSGKSLDGLEHTFNPVMYPSGGSWGGCEDPRMVRLEGKIYLTFNAFDGWDYIRMAVSSINEEDFFNRKWKWGKPMLISSPGEIHKNWVLFPEKIDGKFAILHSISPEVQIDMLTGLKTYQWEIKRLQAVLVKKLLVKVGIRGSEALEHPLSEHLEDGFFCTTPPEMARVVIDLEQCSLTSKTPERF